MKLVVTRKVNETSWRGDKSESISFITFLISGNKDIGNEIQVLVTDEEYNSYSVGQLIEVNPKT